MILGPNDSRALHLSPERKQFLRQQFLEGLDIVTQTCHDDNTHTDSPKEATVPDSNTPAPSASDIAEIHVLADGARGGWIVEIVHTDTDGDWTTTETHVEHLQYAANLIAEIASGSAS